MQLRQRKLSMRGLRTFCAAARHRTLRQAAEELFITASAVSHQLKALEGEFGLELFRREGRTLVLTEAGEMLYEDIRDPMLQVETAASRVQASFARPTLRISVQPYFASELLMPRLETFSRDHPSVELSLDASDEGSGGHPTTMDLSIRLFREPPEGLEARRLLPLTLVPACSPELRDRLESMPQDSTSPFPYVVHSARPNAWKRWAAGSGIQLPPSGSVIRLDAMSAIVQAAERGLGVALVPRQLTERPFAEGRLVQLFAAELETSDAYYLVYRRGVAERPGAREFTDWVLGEFREPGGWPKKP